MKSFLSWINESNEPAATLDELCTVKTNFKDADFWIVRNGDAKNVGKPTKTFSPEHIGIKVVKTDVVDPQYLFYVMLYAHGQGYFERLAHGVLKKQHITTDDVKNFKMKRFKK